MSVPTTYAAFHLWHVKEAYSNADGSVQFIEMFDSFSGENFVGSLTIQANSDGNIKTFTFPSSLDTTKDTANHSILIATPGLAGLPGGVTPDFTLPNPTTNGPFFNPNAANITITYSGSGDSMSFTGASLPKDGIHSLTDAGATGFPPGTPSLGSGINSPTNFGGHVGSVNLAPEPTSGFMLLFVGGALCLRRARSWWPARS
ncbi:MAG TPA: PEP-CTERM sorting domain-containing protein [Lacipirellulaceae bacterium]|nr:PEP-CTERM sorting domain-containing protein [Lacipirellulaceae bacterium]